MGTRPGYNSITAIYKCQSSLPQNRGDSDLPSAASEAKTNDLLQGVILQHDSATPHSAGSVMSLATAGPSSQVFLLLMQHLGDC
jgi:hypothetical protein